jgi:hypothetical protein
VDLEHLDVVLGAKVGPLFRALDEGDARLAVTERAMGRVKVSEKQAVESGRNVDRITRSIGHIPRAAIEATERLERVKLTAAQAAETTTFGDRISNTLDKISRKAGEARRALMSVRLAGAGGAGGLGGEEGSFRPPGGGGGRNGVGVGVFGSGYGRIGVMGAAVGAGTLLGPAAGPAALGLLAAIPTLAAAGAGALGVLALGFQGVGKAIGGDKKAFDGLTRSQQQFVLGIRSLSGWFDRLKETAASSMFPGLTAGLHAALSPQTLAAITKAVQQFGTAIGQAGAQWGRYFGSSQFTSVFGPLMSAGAQTFRVMSDAALHLFDALGVLGKAAIPFTSWITRSIDAGSRWLSVWLRAKDATGQLGGAMNEAKTSLQIVAGLFMSLVRVVGALGQALYPVSKVAVKDLTGGLNALAAIFHRNQDVIRQLVGGALQGLVGAVKLGAGAIELLNKALERFVGDKSRIVTAITVVGAALALWMGPQSAAITGAIIGIGLIATHWKQVSTLVKGVLTGFGQWTAGFFEKWGAETLKLLAFPFTGMLQLLAKLPLGMGKPFQQALDAINGPLDSWIANGKVRMTNGGLDMGDAWPSAFTDQVQSALERNGVAYAGASGKASSTLGAGPGMYPPGARGGSLTGAGASTKRLSNKQLQALWIKAGGDPRLAPTMAAIALAESSGNPVALNDNPSTGDYSVGPWQVNYFGNLRAGRTRAFGTPEQLMGNPLLDAKAAVAIYKSQGLGAWSTYTSGAYLINMPAGAGMGDSSAFGAVPAFTKNAGPTAAQRAAASFKSQIGQLAAKAKADADRVNKLAKDGLLPVSLLALLRGRVKAVETEISKAGGKKELPGIRTDLSDLGKAINLGVRQAGDVADVKKIAATVNADLKNGLLTPELASTLLKKASTLNAKFAKAILDPAELKPLEKNKTELAKQVAQAVAQVTAIKNFDAAIAKTKTELAAKLRDALKLPVLYATSETLDAAERSAERIKAALRKLAPGTAAAAKAKQDLKAQQAIIVSGLQGLEAAVERAQAPFERAWSRLADRALQAFDSITQTGLDQMQRDTEQALRDMQITVSGFGFRFGGSIDKTPAEQQLEAMQDAHDLAELQRQLAEDEASGDTEAAAEDRYQIQLRAVQKQADLERAAAEKQLQDAQDAYQRQQDLAEQQYEVQRGLQREALQDQLDDWKTQAEQGGADVMGKVSATVGPLAAAAGLTLGGAFTTAFTKALAASAAALNALVMQLNRANLGLDLPTIPPGGLAGLDGTDWASQVGIISGYSPGVAAGDLASTLFGIPGFASGGQFWTDGPTPIMTGEGGEPEFVSVTPKSKMRPTHGGGSQVIEVHTTVELDGAKVAKSVRKHLLRDKRRLGKVGLA